MFPVLEEIRDLLETAMTTRCNKYYVGKIQTRNVPKSYAPALCVYGINTNLVGDQLTTARDKWTFEIGIDLWINAFEKTDQDGVETDKVLDAQKELYDIMEERETDMTPKSNTIAGTLRANIKGTDYLFNNDLVISYPDEGNEVNSYLMKATATLSLTTRFTNRP